MQRGWFRRFGGGTAGNVGECNGEKKRNGEIGKGMLRRLAWGTFSERDGFCSAPGGWEQAFDNTVRKAVNDYRRAV